MNVTISPKNHWATFAQALDLLGEGKARQAWRILSSLRYSELIGPHVFEEARRLVASALQAESCFLLNYPADYWREQLGQTIPRAPAKLDFREKLPGNFPADMVLAPLVGCGNDFGFVTDAARFVGFNGPLPSLRMRLVFSVATSDELSGLASQLGKVFSTLVRLPSIDLVVLCPPEIGQINLGWRTRWDDPSILKHSPDDQMRLFADGTDIAVFLPGSVLADPFVLERTLRYIALNPMVIPTFSPLSADVAAVQTVLNEELEMAEWRRIGFAFRRVRPFAFAISTTLLRRLDGFSPRFLSAEYTTRELVYRAYNEGAYFIPLAVRSNWTPPEIDSEVIKVDRATMYQLCPHPWERKKNGCFEVPKVSIYIPAYRAARYLGLAIDSVLSQNFNDLEVCVVNDGSPDTTEDLLKSYAGERRVRFITTVNGGIGSASNRAIRMSRGLYIGQLDSDDRLKPGAVKRLVEYLDKNSNVGCAYGACERVDSANTYICDEYNFKNFSREKMQTTSIVHHFRMFRRSLWMRSEGFREDIVNAVDYDIYLKMSEMAPFHHVDTKMYERRWHGQNTSKKNESAQTQNTYRVLHQSLERQGLARYWEVHVKDPLKPRNVTYKRTCNRVFFWPDYNNSNPYQRLLYSQNSGKDEFIGMNPDSLLQLLRSETDCGEFRTVFHVHWLNPILKTATTVGKAVDAAAAFVEKLKDLKLCGVRIIWTIHNIVSHDTRYVQVEIQLARQVIELADAIHVHCMESLPEIEKFYKIPREKLHIARHGSYVRAYPDFVTREAARQELSIMTDDQVILFFGQIRPYKGLNELISVFRGLLPKNPKLRLLLAGSSQEPVLSTLEALGLSEQELKRITLYNRFIHDSEVQLFFHAADYSVFPYRSILTSGSVLLSLGFGVPVVVPDFAMLSLLLENNAAGVLYDRDGGEPALQQAIASMLEKLNNGQRAEMSEAAKRRAEAERWQNLDAMLFSTQKLDGTH